MGTSRRAYPVVSHAHEDGLTRPTADLSVGAKTRVPDSYSCQDQIVRKLAEGNKLLAGASELDVVCRHLESATTSHDHTAPTAA
jgi:hypothetical protein